MRLGRCELNVVAVRGKKFSSICHVVVLLNDHYVDNSSPLAMNLGPIIFDLLSLYGLPRRSLMGPSMARSHTVSFTNRALGCAGGSIMPPSHLFLLVPLHKTKQGGPSLALAAPVSSRTFLTSLILASNFTMEDCCYSNRAWAKLSSPHHSPREIGRCDERALGEALQAEWCLRLY